MKKVLFTFLATLVFSAFSYAQGNSDNDNAFIGKAKGALASQCEVNVGFSHGSVNTVSACFVDGFVKKVTIYRPTPCPPNQICIQVIENMGTVTFNCDGTVADVQCGPPVFQL